MKIVTREEFFQFVSSYPGRLTRDVCGIAEPAFVSYTDCATDKIVACYNDYENRDGSPNNYQVEERPA